MAIHTNPVIARSKATWQSIFQVVQDSSWIASPPARNDSGRLAMTPIYVIARSKATWQSIFHVVQDERWIASPSARNDGGWLAMTPIPVIARSKATWQSTPTPSLRGAKRRGNPYFRQCRTQDGLLRLRLAMTVGGSQ